MTINEQIRQYVNNKMKMCVSHDNCADCPMSTKRNGHNISCAELELDYTDEAIRIVNEFFKTEEQK